MAAATGANEPAGSCSSRCVARESMVERSSINWRKEIATPNFRWNKRGGLCQQQRIKPNFQETCSRLHAVETRAGKFLHQRANKSQPDVLCETAPATRSPVRLLQVRRRAASQFRSIQPATADSIRDERIGTGSATGEAGQ